MSFFDEQLLTNFSLDIKEHFYLYSLNTLINTFKMTRTAIINDIIALNCQDSIGRDYIEDLLKLIVKKNTINPKYDLVVITETVLTQPNDPGIFKGFAIVQQGECNKYPDTFCLNLICSAAKKGKILLGLYLYIIKNNINIVNKIGLLELANGYINAAGFCLYSKYGFVYDIMLYGDCFPYCNNMPMICDLTNISSSDINEVINSNKQLMSNPSTEFQLLCAPQDPKLQLCIGICCNLLRYVTLLTDHPIITEYDISGYALRYVLSNRATICYDKLFHAYNNENDIKDLITSLTTDPKNIAIFLSEYYIPAQIVAPPPTPTGRLTRSVAAAAAARGGRIKTKKNRKYVNKKNRKYVNKKQKTN
jgi:hypothetical protein